MNKIWLNLWYWWWGKVTEIAERKLRRAWLRMYRGYPSEPYMGSEPFHLCSNGSAASGPAYGVTGQQEPPHDGSEP